MRYYPLLRDFPETKDRVRVIETPQRLSGQLDKNIPANDSEHLSDYKPMWVRLQVNDSGDYLERLKTRKMFVAPQTTN